MVNQNYRIGPMCSDMWITKPWPPIRRRIYGFGTIHQDSCVIHNTPNPIQCLHHTWTYPTPRERFCCSQVNTLWKNYIKLRAKAIPSSLHSLRLSKSKTQQALLCEKRAQLHSLALLRFDFNHGDFIQWMSSKYTNRHRNWEKEWKSLIKSRVKPLPSYYPIPDYNRASQTQAEGAPLKGKYTTPHQEVFRRVMCKNHLTVN